MIASFQILASLPSGVAEARVLCALIDVEAIGTLVARWARRAPKFVRETSSHGVAVELGTGVYVLTPRSPAEVRVSGVERRWARVDTLIGSF